MTSDISICKLTGIRTAVCCCGTCAKGATAAEKYGHAHDDAKALAALIADCLDSYPGLGAVSEQPRTWSDAGSMVELRERLMAIAIWIRSADSEMESKRGIEEALDARDDVDGALIEAMA